MFDFENCVMGLLVHAGEARSCAMQAMQLAREQQWDEARKALADADTAAREAHKVQTALISEDEGSGKIAVPLILVHAQDHLMTAMLCRDLAEEMILLREEIWHTKQG
ncbi:PTS lactose/cellobiose transporter subunit IIA [Mangrovibacter phragmitis]|jgi:PTS system cellobiose-specific IIA component|uniref:PTS lactose/cellobiose transporter subunit IIA n=1 Tax=Mangrovibacter phragmitis TaxID=1691903 RepID=UPI0035151F18